MLVRWVLLCALALGVLGMHHLTCPSHDHGLTDGHGTTVVSTQSDASALSFIATAQTGDGSPAAAAEPMAPMPDRGLGHDLLVHLCLAILAAATGIGLLLILLRHRAANRPRPDGATAPARAGPRPPPLPTSTRLASLCVLRL